MADPLISIPVTRTAGTIMAELASAALVLPEPDPEDLARIDLPAMNVFWSLVRELRAALMPVAATLIEAMALHLARYQYQPDPPQEMSARYEFDRREFEERLPGPWHILNGDVTSLLNDDKLLPLGCWLAWPHEGRCQRLTARRRVG